MLHEHVVGMFIDDVHLLTPASTFIRSQRWRRRRGAPISSSHITYHHLLNFTPKDLDALHLPLREISPLRQHPHTTKTASQLPRSTGFALEVDAHDPFPGCPILYS